MELGTATQVLVIFLLWVGLAVAGSRFSDWWDS